jgi:LPS export ABC transporter permease LptF
VKLADRYLLSELFGPLFLASGGFLLFMVANIIFLLVNQIVSKQIPFSAVIELLVLRIPAILVLTFPVAMLFACLLGVGKLAADHEIMAMRTSGISFIRLALPIFLFSFFLVIAAFVTNNDIAPWTTHKSEDIVRRILMRETIPPVQPNVFIHGPNQMVFYIGEVNRLNHFMYHVMIYEPSSVSYPKLVTASRARYNGRNFYLYDGSIHDFNKKGLTRYEASFKEMIIPVTIDPRLFLQGEKTPFEMTASQLKKQIKIFKKGGISTAQMTTDYYLKYSIPFGCLIASLIGVPLGVKFPKGGKFISIALAIFLLFIYYCLFSLCRALGIAGILSPIVAAWLPNFLLGGVGIGFLILEEVPVF